MSTRDELMQQINDLLARSEELGRKGINTEEDVKTMDGVVEEIRNVGKIFGDIADAITSAYKRG